MKAVLVLMDSLNRHMLPMYGNNWVIAPHLQELASESVRFDRHFVGSAPCMPARRDILTSRLNFLERGWGGVEPFDRCFPETLSEHGVLTHLVTDHYHYFQVGGENYHCAFDTWEAFRGQEHDGWISRARPPEEPPHLGQWSRAYAQNRTQFKQESDYPTPRTFDSAAEWVDCNGREDNWFLMVEAFDPHEPFDCPQEFLDLYGDDWQGPEFIWPNVAPDDLDPEALLHIRRQYAACLTMADRGFGRLMAALERQGCLEDTLIIVTTDHGHMLGEHGFFAKNYMHAYDELALIPLLVRLPGGAHGGEARRQITQNIDIAPTLLEYFGLQWDHPIHGESWWPCIKEGAPVCHDYALFGWFGSTVNVTDGRYTYLRAPIPSNEPLYQYGCMPGNYNHYWPRAAFGSIDAGRYLSYTDMPVFRLPMHRPTTAFISETLLYDREEDPAQEHNLAGTPLEARYIELLRRAMGERGAPSEQYTRLGLD